MRPVVVFSMMTLVGTIPANPEEYESPSGPPVTQIAAANESDDATRAEITDQLGTRLVNELKGRGFTVESYASIAQPDLSKKWQAFKDTLHRNDLAVVYFGLPEGRSFPDSYGATHPILSVPELITGSSTPSVVVIDLHSAQSTSPAPESSPASIPGFAVLAKRELPTAMPHENMQVNAMIYSPIADTVPESDDLFLDSLIRFLSQDNPALALVQVFEKSNRRGDEDDFMQTPWWTLTSLSSAFHFEPFAVDESYETGWITKLVDIRDGPGQGHRVAGELVPGEVVDITGKVRDREWLQVSDEAGRRRYVSARAVTTTNPVEVVDGVYLATADTRLYSAPVERYQTGVAIVPGRQVRVNGRFNNTRWVRISVSGRQYWVTIDSLASLIPVELDEQYYASTDVRARSDLEVGWTHVTAIHTGQMVTATGTVNVLGKDWLRILPPDAENAVYVLMNLMTSVAEDHAAFDLAQVEDTAASYEEYRRNFVVGIHRDAAKRYQDDAAAFEAAKAANTDDAYEQYMTDYPNGRHVNKALKALYPLRREIHVCPRTPTLVPIHVSGNCRDVSRSYAVGKFEVTFDEWDFCVENGGCRHRPSSLDWGRGQRPVINVNYDDARSYVAWLSQHTGLDYRLLSGGEWECAARGGSETPFHTGTRIGNMARYNSVGSAPVGFSAQNYYGLHDVHGNVWEWTTDCWGGREMTSVGDGVNACKDRVLRGGSWTDQHAQLTFEARLRGIRSYRGIYVGFRVGAKLVQPEECPGAVYGE